MTDHLLRQTPAPEWLAHRYDPGQDAVHLIKVDRAARRRVPFLTDENLPDAGEPVVARRADIVGSQGRTPVNFVFHSAYCCSTLLANAYDRPRRSFSLKEPVLLNDIVGWTQRGGPPATIDRVLRDGVDLLARPFVAGESCVIKPSNVVNVLAADLLESRPEAGTLLLYAPLEVYLGSIASKGLWGRLWVRELFGKFAAAGLTDLGFEPREHFLQTDLQIAALGWLAQHALFARLAQRWPDRVRTLDSEVMLRDPAGTLASLDTLFGVADDAAGRAAVVAEVFSRHAKFGDAFDAGARTAGQHAAAEIHRDEIDKVLAWARAVADHAGVALTLPRPLLEAR